MAVRYGRGPWDDVTARALPEEQFCPVAQPGLLDGAATPLTARAIARLPLIHDSDLSGWRDWMAARGVTYRAKASDMRFEDYDLALDAARHGIGVLLYRTTDGNVHQSLVALNTEFAPTPRQHWVLTAENEARPAVLRFADRLTGHIKDAMTRTDE